MNFSVVVSEEARAFLLSLEVKLRAKAFRTIELLQAYGPLLGMPHSRKIVGTDSLHELRVHQGSNICRLFYFYKGNELYVIVSGFVKKADKTDKREIERAVRFMNEYLEEDNGEDERV